MADRAPYFRVEQKLAGIYQHSDGAQLVARRHRKRWPTRMGSVSVDQRGNQKVRPQRQSGSNRGGSGTRSGEGMGKTTAETIKEITRRHLTEGNGLLLG